MSIITEYAFYLAAVPAIVVTGVSKGGFGVGLGVFAVPLMALTVPPAQAAGIMLPLLCAMDLVGLWSYRRYWHGRVLAVALPASLVGIGVGTATFHLLDDNAIRLIIGTIAVVFTLHRWLAPRRADDNATRTDPPIPVLKGTFWSAVSGFTSFVAHAGTPPLSVFLLPLRLEKTLFAGTAVVYFALVNYIKLVPYAWLGQLGSTNLETALLLGPLALFSMGLGVWLHHRINAALFFRLVYVFVFVAGVKLLWEGAGL